MSQADVLVGLLRRANVMTVRSLSGDIQHIYQGEEIEARLEEVVFQPRKCSYCGAFRKNTLKDCPTCGAPPMED